MLMNDICSIIDKKFTKNSSPKEIKASIINAESSLDILQNDSFAVSIPFLKDEITEECSTIECIILDEVIPMRKNIAAIIGNKSTKANIGLIDLKSIPD